MVTVWSLRNCQPEKRLLFMSIFKCIIKLCAILLMNFFKCFLCEVSPQNASPREEKTRFLYFAPLCVSSTDLPARMHIDYICLIFLHWEFSYVSSNSSPLKMHSYIGCICFDFSPLWIFKCCLKWSAREDAKSHWLQLFNFSPMCIFKCILNALA